MMRQRSTTVKSRSFGSLKFGEPKELLIEVIAKLFSMAWQHVISYVSRACPSILRRRIKMEACPPLEGTRPDALSGSRDLRVRSFAIGSINNP